MPQKEALEREKRRAILFSDLGRPTRRGVRFCPKCQTKNGTRGHSCKNKSCDVIFRDHNGSKRKSTTDACRISTISSPGLQIYSVRIRDRGPDYRNFVQLPIQEAGNNSTTTATSSSSIQPIPVLTENDDLLQTDSDTGIQSLSKCFIDICSKTQVFPCSHIKSAQKCFSDAKSIIIKRTTVAALNIPYESKEVLLEMFVKDLSDQLIQRVSKYSFIMKCPINTRHPHGFLHILFFKNEDRNTDPKFLCTCRPYKVTKTEAELFPLDSLTPHYETSAKLCIHFFACICAFASHEELEIEFEYFVSHVTSQVYPQRPSDTALAEIDLVDISNEDSEAIELEPMDENQMSAEIIRENMSLLESIAGADDAALPNGLENDLADEIIVTSVDDSLNFGDSSALDGLDDPDAQVSGHLTHISEILSHSNPNQQVVCQIFTNSNNLHGFGNTDNDLNDQNDFLNSSSNLQHQSSFKQAPSKKQKLLLSKNPTSLRRGQDGSLIDSGFMQHNDGTSMSVIDNRLIESGFEKWLAGINERINASMNYQFTGKPEPLVLYVPQEHFDILKERITSGWKKKRLPNQTVVVQRRDRPPLGTFTKHIWKITNIVHVLHIFHCSIVPLKINQFFIQTSNSGFDEWVPTKEAATKNTPIIPVLHSTSIKIGRMNIISREIVPFTIEWIQDLLPQSGHGELSLIFQFHHSGPIHTDEERRSSCAPLQKLLQTHSLTLSKHDLTRIGITF